jgi:primosomal protein N'
VSSGSYRDLKRPYLDLVRAGVALSKARGLSLMLGDFPLPLEYRPDMTAPLMGAPSISVIDTKGKPEDTKNWALFDARSIEAMQLAIEEHGKVVLLAHRRGYAPIVVCRDCGTPVRDEGGKALTLAKAQGGKNTYRTSRGTVVKAADTLCAVCGSWNLLPLGVGIERVEEEVKKLFKNSPVIRFDADTANTEAKARRLLKDASLPGTILVGTEALLPYLPREFADLSVIVSADSLLALPFWRSRERFVRTAFMLAERSKHTIMQTRHIADAAVETIQNPQGAALFTEETALRRVLGYPPFATLITCTVEGSPLPVENMEALIRKTALPDEPMSVSKNILAGGKIRLTILFSKKAGEWPSRLSERLASLPPTVRIMVDPESLW